MINAAVDDRQSTSSEPVGMMRMRGFLFTGTLKMPPVISAPRQ